METTRNETDTVDSLKALGNKAFQERKFQEANEKFSQAIELDGSNHVLYSNRSASQASLKNYQAALKDAQQCVTIKPNWPKGYSRLGAAYQGLGDFEEAKNTYDKGLQVDPENKALKDAKEELFQEQRNRNNPGIGKGLGNLFGGGGGGAGGGIGALFQNPEVMSRLARNPKTAGLLGDPEVLRMMSLIQSDPSQMTQFLGNPKFQAAFQVALGLDSMDIPAQAKQADEAQNIFSDDKEQDFTQTPANTSMEKEQIHQEEPKVSSYKQEKNVSSESSQQASRDMESEPKQGLEDDKQKQAVAEKEKGNNAYKQKKFEQALKHYTKAMELYDQDISFITNRAAVYFEMGDYEQCIKDCDEAVEKGRDMRADYKLVARALSRKGSALVKLQRLEEAIQVYYKSLTEHRNADTLKKVQDTEKLYKEQQEKDYINIDLSNDEKNKGNQAFKENKYPEAVKYYSEALKRGPPAINPEAYKIYSNRAACFTKLGAFPEGIKDADKCILLKPDFAKGYSRKGHLQFFMKEYEQALETYDQGLKMDPGNQELMEGAQRCREEQYKFMSGSASEQEMNERRQRAMQDPEVQNILRDPVINQVLMDLQQNPKQAQKHFANPVIGQKLQKLMASGIIQTK